jgi:hypothetical protein
MCADQDQKFSNITESYKVKSKKENRKIWIMVGVIGLLFFSFTLLPSILGYQTTTVREPAPEDMVFLQNKYLGVWLPEGWEMIRISKNIQSAQKKISRTVPELFNSWQETLNALPENTVYFVFDTSLIQETEHPSFGYATYSFEGEEQDPNKSLRAFQNQIPVDDTILENTTKVIGTFEYGKIVTTNAGGQATVFYVMNNSVALYTLTFFTDVDNLETSLQQIEEQINKIQLKY